MTDDADGRRQLVEQYLAAYNRFDVAGMMAVLAPDVVFENYSADTLTASAAGAAEFRTLAEASARLFAAREQRLSRFEPTADGAVADIAYRGTLAADLPNGPKAGDTLELVGRSEFVIAGGRIRRITDRS